MPWSICSRGNPLPHFTLHHTPASLGVNAFAQDLSRRAPFLEFPMCFLHSLLLVRYYIYSRLITAQAPWLPWIYTHRSTGGHSSSTMPTNPVYLWPKAIIRLCWHLPDMAGFHIKGSQVIYGFLPLLSTIFPNIPYSTYAEYSTLFPFGHVI